MFTEPLADFFSTAEFAEEALWSAGGTVQVIFDNGYAGVQFGQLEVASLGPVAYIRASQVPGLASGQTLTIRGVAYTTRAPEPDESGNLLVVRLIKP